MNEKSKIFYWTKIILYVILGILLSAHFIVHATAANSDNWSWPTTVQTIRNDWPKYSSSGDYHSGTDFGVPVGTPVYSTCDGTVETIKSLTTSFGKHIKIKAVVNGETVYMRYCHLSDFAVSEGDTVKSGQVIGYSGSTGKSTGPHLHYEVRNEQDHYGDVSNPTLNPRDYLPGSSYKYATNEEEETDKETEKNDVTRDVVLVLDRSGSMSGYPLEQTKEAAVKFIDTVFEKEAQVSVVTYDSSVNVECGLTNDQQELTECIDGIYEGGSTNMYAGLEQADSILQGSQAQRKIIVLMSDGLPNEGVSDGLGYTGPLIQYAEEMKNRGYYIYTLGFFTDVYGYELTSAQQLMEGIASPRLHYEVNSAEDLVFFFDDIADQIAGTRYVYIRIACPVDVTVSSNGETLTSKADSENTRTSFGALTYENVQEDSEGTYEDNSYEDLYDSFYGNEEGTVPDRVKVLRLKMDEDYDVKIEGYDKGKMNYTVSYPNENGEYDDVREFPDIAVTASTRAVSNTGESKETYLKVDENGDGKYETTYKTEANGKMEEVKDRTLLYLVILGVVILLLALLILILVLVRISGRKKKNQRKKGWETVKEGYIYGAFGIFEGQSYPMGRGEQCVIGRNSNCDIQLKHGQVSRVHCVIQMLPDGVYQVTDCSSNGTFYNNQRLKYKQPYRLPKGALLAIGDADNVLELK